MQGNYGTLILASLIVFGCTLLLNVILALLSPASSGFFSQILYLAGLLIVNTLYNVLMAGIFRLYLNLATKQPFSIRDIFYAFRIHPEPIAVYSAICLLAEIAFFYLLIFLSSGMIFGSFWLSLVLMILVFLALMCFLLTFSCFLFLHARDPWRSTKELLTGCIQMMNGHRLALLWLSLTFLGVLLLCVLSLGLGLLFAVPYIQMTVTLFYEQLAQ